MNLDARDADQLPPVGDLEPEAGQPTRPHYAVRLERRPPVRLTAHPTSHTDEDQWVEWANAQSKPLAVDLFAGGGGLSLGLQQAGFQVAASVDTDRWSVETHAHNFGGLSLDWDLSDLPTRERLIGLLNRVKVGIVAGGPPCQPFSRAGRSKIRSLVNAGSRESVDTRRDLWRAFLDVVVATRPEAVLMENVPDMALGDDVAVVRTIVEELETAGYACNVAIRNAWEHGVPQHRQRLIVVATLDAAAAFTWPRKRPLESVLTAIGDLPELGETTGSERLAYEGPQTKFQKRARRDVGDQDVGYVHDHVTRPVRPDDRIAFDMMDPSTKYSDLPKDLRRYRDDSFDDKYKRLDGDGLSRTITAHISKDGYWYIHPTEPRTLTVREAARIQTFPDSYRFAGPRSAAFRQIGNAVPPALAQSIGQRIHKAIRPGKDQPRDRVPESVRVAAAQAALDTWADERAAVTPWRFPSTPWHAVVTTVMSRWSRSDVVDAVLTSIPTPEDATDEHCEKVASTFRGSAVPRAVRRLPALAEGLRGGGTEVATDLLTPGEFGRAATYTAGSGASTLIVSPGTTRVATRVLGGTEGKNLLTSGKLGVARLVGSGDQGQRRMAAVVAVAEEFCFPGAALCGDCPFQNTCLRSPRGPKVGR